MARRKTRYLVMVQFPGSPMKKFSQWSKFWLALKDLKEFYERNERIGITHFRALVVRRKVRV